MNNAHCVAIIAAILLRERQHERNIRNNPATCKEEVEWAVMVAGSVLDEAKRDVD